MVINTGQNRRKATGRDVIFAVIQVLGAAVLILAGALSISLITAVYQASKFGKELSPGLIALLAGSVGATLGAALGYIGGLLTNTNGHNNPEPPTAREIGQGIAEVSESTPIHTEPKPATKPVLCAICGEPIEETGTSYKGKPVHIECYYGAKIADEAPQYEQHEAAERDGKTDTIDESFFASETEDEAEHGN